MTMPSSVGGSDLRVMRRFGLVWAYRVDSCSIADDDDDEEGSDADEDEDDDVC